MVSPVYALEEWLANLLRTQSEVPVLAILFLVCLVILPLILLTIAGWLSRLGAGDPDAPGLVRWSVRFVYALAPMGLGIWLAHYGFHFLTGFWTFVPVVQSFVSDVTGRALLAVMADAVFIGPGINVGYRIGGTQHNRHGYQHCEEGEASHMSGELHFISSGA